MFKPQKPTTPNQPTKHKLPLVERPPKQEDIATLFTGAQRIRGGIFEMPIRPTPTGQTFVITCQFDHASNDMVWTMMSDEATIWSLPQSDLDLVFDMVVMACQQGGAAYTGSSIPPELAPPPGGQVDYQSQAPNQQYSGGTGAGAPGQAPAQQYQQQQQNQPANQNYQNQPYQQNPYQQNQYQGGQQQYPPQQQQYGQPNQGFPQQQGYGQAPPQQQQYGGNYPPAQNTGAYPTQSPQTPIWNPGAGPAPSSSNANSAPIPDVAEMGSFLNMLNKGQPNLLLGHLFVESGLVPEKCLDAALKLQEMVREGKLNDAQAILALKRCTELGGVLDENIIAWAKDPEKTKKPQTASSTPAGSSTKARDNAAAQRVVDLLKQAGLVSEADVEAAQKVRTKHGGELGQILVSAGKIGGKTLEAAGECQEHVSFGRLRIDKAIMALHFCERMRVGLKEALSELSITLD